MQTCNIYEPLRQCRPFGPGKLNVWWRSSTPPDLIEKTFVPGHRSAQVKKGPESALSVAVM